MDQRNMTTRTMPNGQVALARRCNRRSGTGGNGVTTNAWLVGGNDSLPSNSDESYILGITDDTAMDKGITVVTNSGERIHIRGAAPLGSPWPTQLTGRVGINNGVIETLSVPMSVQHVVDNGATDPTFVDLYMNLSSNAYTVTLGEDDTSADDVVYINNILGAQVNPAIGNRALSGYPANLGALYNTTNTPAITDMLTLREFTYTFRIINDPDSTDPLSVTFTPPTYGQKLTPTDVSYTLAPYDIPAGGYMIATFRVIRSLDAGNIPFSEHHMMIAHTVYPGGSTP